MGIRQEEEAALGGMACVRRVVEAVLNEKVHWNAWNDGLGCRFVDQNWK